MTEKKYIIKKEGREISNITRAGNVTILDASLGIAYSEPGSSFNSYLSDLRALGYIVELKTVLS